jgi:salicylate hydroxylase
LINQQILIAGGGIGGMTAALALARAGQQVTLLEKAAEHAQVGAGLQLGPNAMHALAALGVADAVLATACLPEAIVVRHAVTGRSLSHILLGHAVQQRYGQVYATVHRADLHAALLHAVQNEANVQLYNGEALLEVRQNNSPHAGKAQEFAVQAQSSHQARSADAVVVADGVWSQIRQAVFSDGMPKATGHVAYRAMVPIADVPLGLRANQIGVWWGRDVHVVHYPVRSGAFLNLVVLSEQPVDQAVTSWASKASAYKVALSVQGACPELRSLLTCVGEQEGAWQSWHLYSRPAARSWLQGRVALLGDAAHPMLPYLAQGAAMAVEDAVELASCVSQHPDWDAALQRYQSLRKARCERVVATAQRNGRIFHLPAPWSVARDAVLALKGTEVLGMPWLYGYKSVRSFQISGNSTTSSILRK